MNRATIGLLYKHEMRMLLRDRRTVVLSILLPLLVLPAILFGFKFMNEWRQEQQDTTTYRYTVVGAYADSVRTLIARGELRAADGPGENGDQAENGDPAENAGPAENRDEDRQPASFLEVEAAIPDSSLASGDLDFYLEALTGSEADSLDLARAAADTTESGDEDDPTEPGEKTVVEVTVADERYPGVPVVRVYYRANRDDSRRGSALLVDRLVDARKQDRAEALRVIGLESDPEEVIRLSRVDVATPEQAAGFYFGRLLPLLLVFLTLTGASVAAMDSVAGEKERGSLETLLTTSVRRIEIIAAKQLTILSVALFITLAQAGNLFVYLGLGLIDLPSEMDIDVSPVAVLMLFALYIPVAIVVSSLLLLISAYAKTYKETQLYLLPVFLGLMVLTAAGLLPAVSLRSLIAVVPVANVSVAVREIMVGHYDIPMLLVACASMLLAAFLLLRWSSRMLDKERLVTAQDLDEADLAGGAALFPRRVLLWFLGMWAIVIIAPSNIDALTRLEGQWAFNMFGVFFLGSLLMIRVHRLDWRQALAIRPVRPQVWLAVLLLVPSTLLTGIFVVGLSSVFLPFPEELLEQFASELLPDDFPLWQIMLMMALTPGIVEEMAFRGLLLHGLHRRLRPVVLILVVGIIFGLFHQALFRIIPTTYLGVVITTVAVLTGSIFPCMLLHAGNNAFAFLLYRYGVEIETCPPELLLLNVPVFVFALYLLYRYRTPYPGLLPIRKGVRGDPVDQRIQP
ncbi:MAG: CPBP family intramembrane metalloprotease [Gemmatimonadetes bacterium]|nr:CPBP family intramembrane metalloprotease [Gemmatimonadota bacterium]MYB62935.1 CPBP family intramembrane metalloprotease [Gemmatimonadota bacterium]